MSFQASTSPVVERARQMFFGDGMDPGTELAPYILRSWQRCRALPSPWDSRDPLQGAELLDRREAAAWLRQCAQPELDALSEHVLGQGCVVILSDASGLILDEIGSPDFLPKAQRVALAPGVDWSEAARGTNAIGTVLRERDALTVLGGEHYLTQNGILGCAAAPVFDEQGELQGVLDISGESVQVDRHALGLVRLAAAQLEHRMMSRRSTGQLLRFHRRPGLLDTPREGLLSVQDGVIVGANRVALGLLGMDWRQALGQEASRIFGDRWRRLQARPGLVASADGQQWAVSVEPAAGSGAGRTVATVQLAAGEAAEPADATEALLGRAVRVMASGIAILVSGETGSGKDVFVRRLHQHGRRAAGPLVAVNCAALPENLIEAELFGYEDGAFTGARRRGMPGRLREAHGGLLFLDEIGDMPLSLQSRLLRVLEDRLVRPLGGSRDFLVDFDLVCATHHDLQALVQAGRFRQDLLYRLQGYAVTVPPLRERGDRRRLLQALFEQAGARARGLRLTPAALDALEHRAWPGNIREALGVLRSLVALADDGALLDAADVAMPGAPHPSVAPAMTPAMAPEPAGGLAAITDHAVEQALQACGGQASAAAQRLGVHRSTVYRYLSRKRGRQA
ncbi:GAF domain-containing protein [Xylophilus rhododendri]|uniref:GAF domain-containing protein n=1 Tax=Xylophilus rhododendri TaxID=2697032 RepID=A0A857JBY7_9BURK|nr:sigma-54-dependent Fis family transcriptional regulator [Xylophilus rhododendri]QHJ00692.1 GAF domain-containing protein [Xylophilus rhododendri]